MNWKPDRYSRLRALLRGERVAEDVGEEFEHHLRLRTETLIANGMAPAEARAEALSRFGDLSRFQRETVAIEKSVLRERKRMEVFDSLRRELQQSARGLMRSPGFALVAILTLALGIGATTAVYTMLDAVVLNPLPYADADRLVKIDHAVPGQGADVHWGVATASYFHYAERARSVEGAAAYWVNTTNLRGRGAAFRGETAQVTANLFDLMGARPAVGRFFRADEDVPGATLVAVLSHELWQREYGGERSVVGQTVEINGGPIEIIGVNQPGFKLPDQTVDVWYPRQISAGMRHVNWHHLTMLVKRKSGVTVEAVQQEFLALSRELPERFPNVYSEDFMSRTKFQPRAQDLRASIVGDISRTLWIILGSVGVVLVIACANVANLFMVRNETRSNELAVRSALGAERAHIAVQSLAESLLLSIVAGLLGLFLAFGGLKLLLAIAPADLPRLSDIRLSTEALLFAVGLSLMAGLVFGLFPLFRRRTDFAPLREAGRGMTTTRAQLRVRSVLVTAQIALALVLMAAAGLMLRSYERLTRIDSGIEADNVLTLDVSLPFRKYNTYELSTQYWKDVKERIAALAGVLHVGGTAALPFSSSNHGCSVLWTDPPASDVGHFVLSATIQGSAGCISTDIVLPGTFEALGVPVRGRTTTWTDIQSGTGAIMLTRTLADRLWPGQEAIGKGIRGNGPGAVYYRVVGVTDDYRGEGFQRPPVQMVFFPMAPIEGAPLWAVIDGLNLIIKTAGDPSQIAPAIRRAVNELDPSVAIGQMRTMDQVMAQSIVHTSFTMILLGLAGFMALVLSVVGLYGVVSYVVSRRRSEIGIRMALGAPASEVGGMIVMQSVRLAAVGIAIGLIGAFLTTQMLQTLLFEVEPTDAVTLTAASFFLLATSALAAFVPARRAARVSPVEALRS